MSVRRNGQKEGWKGIILPRKPTTPGRYKQVRMKKRKDTRALVDLPGGNGPRFSSHSLSNATIIFLSPSFRPYMLF